MNPQVLEMTNRPTAPLSIPLIREDTVLESPSSINSVESGYLPAASKKKNRERVTWSSPPTVVDLNEQKKKKLRQTTTQGTNHHGTHLNPPSGKTKRAPSGELPVLHEMKEDSVQPLQTAATSPSPYSSYTSRSTRTTATSRASFATSSFISDYNGIIDGRYSFCEDTTDYVTVEPDGTGGMSTSEELRICKKTVLNPYRLLLKLIGWRRVKAKSHDLQQPLYVRLFNVVYPIIIISVMVFSYVTQILTCFYRGDQTTPVSVNGSDVMIIECRKHLVTKLIYPDLLLTAAYLWGLYIFRYGEPEHLVVIMETVFLSYSTSHQLKNKQKWIVRILRLFLVCGLIWIVLDMMLSVARVYSLQLLQPNIHLYFLKIHRDINNPAQPSLLENILRYSFVIITNLCFIFVDLLYIAVIIMYISQNQLIQFYIDAIREKVLVKAYTLDDAIKEINHTYAFMRVMNGKLATLTSLCLLIFLEEVVSSLYILLATIDVEKGVDIAQVVVSTSSLFLWTILALTPPIQASRLTAKCRRLRRLGLETRSRPFIYADTPQLVLDSFLQYTNATRYTAKLASVPIYPSMVVGVVFIFVVFGVFYVTTYPAFQFAPWF